MGMYKQSVYSNTSKNTFLENIYISLIVKGNKHIKYDQCTPMNFTCYPTFYQLLWNATEANDNNSPNLQLDLAY